MQYSVIALDKDNIVTSLNFNFEYEAKHLAVDWAYEGLKQVYVKSFDKIIGRVDNIGSCKAFVYI